MQQKIMKVYHFYASKIRSWLMISILCFSFCCVQIKFNRHCFMANMFWKGLPYRYALSLQVTPSLIHLLQPLVEEVGVLLSVQATDQLLAGAVEAEVHVPVLLNLILQVLEIKKFDFKYCYCRWDDNTLHHFELG